jgi:hypothetical protein
MIHSAIFFRKFALFLIGATTDKVKTKIDITDVNLLEVCYILEDCQFLVYKLVCIAYNWNEAFKENCRISDTLNQVTSTRDP